MLVANVRKFSPFAKHFHIVIYETSASITYAVDVHSLVRGGVFVERGSMRVESLHGVKTWARVVLRNGVVSRKLTDLIGGYDGTSID